MVFFTKLRVIVVILRFFVVLSNFLVVEDYELCKSTSHFLSKPLILKHVRSLSRLTLSNCLPNDILCEITV